MAAMKYLERAAANRVWPVAVKSLVCSRPVVTFSRASPTIAYEPEYCTSRIRSGSVEGTPPIQRMRNFAGLRNAQSLGLQPDDKAVLACLEDVGQGDPICRRSRWPRSKRCQTRR